MGGDTVLQKLQYKSAKLISVHLITSTTDWYKATLERGSIKKMVPYIWYLPKQKPVSNGLLKIQNTSRPPGRALLMATKGGQNKTAHSPAVIRLGKSTLQARSAMKT